MRTLSVVLLLLAGSAFGADVSGKWVFEVQTDAGSGSPKFEFQQAGEKLSGTYSGLLGEAKLSGTVKGNAIEFRFEASGAVVVYKGTIEGATVMKGTVDLGGQATGTWTGRKQ